MASTRRWLDRGNPRDAGARHACQGIFTDNEKALAYAGAFPLDWNRPCPVKRLHIKKNIFHPTLFAFGYIIRYALFSLQGMAKPVLAEIAASEAAIQEAMEVEDVFTKDEVAKRSHEKAEKFRRDQAAQIRYATEEGEAESLKKAVAMLKKLKINKDLAITQIIETYSLSNKEASALVNSNW